MIKLACMTLPYAKFSFERALEGISRAGYRYIAFGHPHEGREYPEENNPESIFSVQALFAKYGLQPILLASNAYFKIDQPLERAIKRLQAAKALGVKEILTVGTQSYRKFPSDPLSEEEMKPLNEAFVERYKRIADEAAALDLVVTVKPHTGNTATAAHLRRTLEQIGSPHVQVSYDPGNVQFYEGIAAHTDLPGIADRTYSLIAKDHRGAQANLDFPIPGTGDVDFPSILATMKQAEFSGSVIVERVDGPAEPEQIDQRISESREHVERMLKEAGFELG
ncbi:MAG: Xylose isomerase-like barrel [Paenibacillus sp.]|jgi:sugar phosphate isomerase/epimerase|nr:Xylose isomerase-like barrel [Paenibacillus sp.]